MHHGIVAWLQGEPGLLARRVVAEGIEKRPLLFGEGVSGECWGGREGGVTGVTGTCTWLAWTECRTVCLNKLCRHDPPPQTQTEDEAYSISLAKLTSLLEARTKYYENADVVVDLTGYDKDADSGAPTAGGFGVVVEGSCQMLACAWTRVNTPSSP
jgi:shikimate kinase